jgi:hypothetical protein
MSALRIALHPAVVALRWGRSHGKWEVMVNNKGAKAVSGKHKLGKVESHAGSFRFRQKRCVRPVRGVYCDG